MSKIDLHIHSCYSNNLFGTRLFSPPSKSFPEDIIKTAIEKGIDVIAVSDHDSVLGGSKTAEIAEKKYKGKILVIPSVEISTADGHILGLNIKKNIPKFLSAEETIHLIKRQGGYPIIAHPFNIKFSLSKEKVESLKKEFFALEAANSHALKNKEVKKYAENNSLAITAGSDAHHLADIGLCYAESTKKIKTLDDLLSAISNREVSLHAYNKHILRRVVPAALKAFFYWKYQQVKHIFNKKVFLPYLDK